MRYTWYLPVLAVVATAGCGSADDRDLSGRARVGASADDGVVAHAIRPRGHRRHTEPPGFALAQR